jgi:hypothetical protein
MEGPAEPSRVAVEVPLEVIAGDGDHRLFVICLRCGHETVLLD